jgi:hypothetical protein
VSKGNRRGIARETARLKVGPQVRTLKEHNFDPIYVLGKDKVELEDATNSLRRGDVAGVTRLHILVNPKLGRRKGQRIALYAAVDAIEDRGAIIEEVDTGRKTSDRKQRDAMIREAAEIVTKGGRGIRSAANGLKGGRPKKEFPPEVIEQARRVWENRKIKTWTEARAKLPKGFSTARAYSLFGKRDPD